MANDNRHIIYAIAQNKPGVLNRVFSLFRRRKFNVESITAGHTHTEGISRFTLVVTGSQAVADQIIKQMYKILEITKVVQISQDSAVIRELALIKVKTSANTRPEILQIVDIFRAKIVDVSHDSLIIEITGDETKISSFEELLHKFGIQEMVRTGTTALKRGGKPKEE